MTPNTVYSPSLPGLASSENGYVMLFAGEEHYRLKLYRIGDLHGRASSKSPLTDTDPSFTHKLLQHDNDPNIAWASNMPAGDKIWFNRTSPATYYRLRSCTATEWRERIGIYFVPVFARPVVLIRRPATSTHDGRLPKAVFVVPSNPEKHRFIPSTDKPLAHWWELLARTGQVRV